MIGTTQQQLEVVARKKLGEVELINEPHLPLFIVALHRLARLGQATRYSNSKRLANFSDTQLATAAKKWPELANVAAITLFYEEH